MPTLVRPDHPDFVRDDPDFTPAVNRAYDLRLWGQAVARFMSNFDQTATDSACWDWTGPRTRSGHGTMTAAGRRNVGAHRFSYLLHVGPIPDGMLVLHTCHRPECVNPGHLFLGTLADKDQAMTDRGRRARGERVGTGRLTEAQVLAIVADPRRHVEVAREYGVTPTTVHCIRTGKAWAWLTGIAR